MAIEQQSLQVRVTGFGAGEELDLSSPEMLRRLQQYVAYLVTNDHQDKAYDFVKKLTLGMQSRGDLFQHPSHFTASYEQLLNLSRGVALSMLSEDDLKSFFQKGVVIAVRNPDIDLLDKANAKMVKLMFLEERDELKKKLRYELRQNYERLTTQPIRTSIGVVAPTVKEWLELAEKQGDPDEPLTVRILENQQFQQLNQNEQEIVGKLLGLDDLLSMSSDSEAGFENPISFVDDRGQRFVLDRGEIRPANDPEADQLLAKLKGLGVASTGTASPKGSTETTVPKSSRTAQQVQQAIRQTQAKSDDEARYEAQEVLLKKIGTDTNALVKNLANGLLVNDGEAVLASLGVLSRFGSLEAALQSASIREAFTQEFLKPLAASAKISLDVVKAMLNRSTKQPQFVAGFLQWALDRALQKNATESARIGSQFGNTLAALGDPSYVAMTYFDVKSGSFKWTPLKMKADGGLEWME